MAFLWWRKKKVQEDIMKYLVVGLGNMGADYDGTRHNVGFDVVDYMANEKSASWKHETLGDLTTIKHKGRTILLLKPSTYMNLSGKAINHWMQKEKIPLDRVLVLVDDLNISFGQVRLRGKGSDGGHNGLKDINQRLGSSYARLRIGIGSDYYKGQQVNFVLGKWTDSERAELKNILPHCAKATLSFCSIGLSHTMSQFNR